MTCLETCSPVHFFYMIFKEFGFGFQGAIKQKVIKWECFISLINGFATMPTAS